MNVVTASPRLERAGKTPSQKAILWLLRRHGRARHEAGSREFRWRIVEGTLTVRAEIGPWDYLLSCGAIALDGSGFAVLTQAGQEISVRYRREPPVVTYGRLPEVQFLTNDQMERIAQWLPVSHGVSRLDDRRVLSGIVHVVRHGLRWSDVPSEYGVPYRRLRNRLLRWSETGVMDQVLANLMECRDGLMRLVVSEQQIRRHPTSSALAARGLLPTLAPVEEGFLCAA